MLIVSKNSILSSIYSKIGQASPLVVLCFEAEKWYLLLIHNDNYRQRVNNASKLCIKPKNPRFIFMQIFSSISEL